MPEWASPKKIKRLRISDSFSIKSKMTISETSSVAYHQEERPAKRQRKTVKRAPAFCIAELGNMFMDNFALSDLGSFKSPKNVYPKVFYNEKPVTFKLNGAKLIKVCRFGPFTLQCIV